MYLVESYIKNGAGFMEYHGMDFDDAKKAFENAWDSLNDEEKADIDVILFTEFEGVEDIDDTYDSIEGKWKPEKKIAKRKGDSVEWFIELER